MDQIDLKDFVAVFCSLGVTTEREIAQNDLSRPEIEKDES